MTDCLTCLRLARDECLCDKSEHVYRSPECFHGDHVTCDFGCKICDAHCICECHGQVGDLA